MQQYFSKVRCLRLTLRSLFTWDFWDQDDPTHGLVNYQNRADALAKNLAVVPNNSTLILAVDNTTTLTYGGKRDSVRISSQKVYNAGTLFIADFAAMPASCGVWPAWWSVGPSWPNFGEIDVLEGVHAKGTNKMTLHTAAGCSVNGTDQMTGTVDGKDCQSSNGNNQGCGVLDNKGPTSSTSYGDGFNKAGGGVYAHSWTKDAIQIWHFARDKIPTDITAKKPDPLQWGLPTGSFSPAPDVDFGQHFQNHTLTIDTTICGDWAGSSASLKEAGCPVTDCAKIVENPKNFDSARWNITYIAVYRLL
ncbi:concanavalin A-like lectin/glucanase domain-containing protein [Mycena epipterygia]|nr:concanavalin A-like lectin/glucanase domain-containing protein [Mycena epipterygia]